MARMIGRALAFASLAMIAAPAAASVKDGVEAWARGDYTAAVEQWRGPAIAGDADAQFNLGQAYKLGRGVNADLAQAELWYARAAAQGHAQAQDNYGLALFQESKKAEALPWLEKSTARDEKRAELVLGTMLFNGDGVAKDWVRAYALVSRSSQQGLTAAGQTLAQMDGYLSPQERQQGNVLATEIEARGRAARVDARAGAAAPVVPVQASERRGRPDAVPLRPMPAGRARAPGAHASTPAARMPPPIEPNRPIAPAPVAPHRPAPPVASVQRGHWRVQLGAFREPGAAQALWARVGGKLGGKPSYVKAGAITRLQAGPFAGKEEAERACRAAGVNCVAVP